MKHDVKQARAWILRLTPGQPPLTPEEIERFAPWMQQHENVFLAELAKHPQLKHAIMEETGRILREARVFSPTTVVPLRSPTPSQWNLSTPLPNERIARGLHHSQVIGLALASVVTVFWLVGTINHWVHPAIVLATQIGEQRRFLLPDGSELILNADTQVVVRLGPHERRLKLENGEARFIVAPDPKRPFHVDTENASITDIGTTFNVHVSPKGTSIAVLEGRVHVAHAGSSESPLTLSADEQGEVTPSGELVRGSSRPLARAKAWTQGRLVFIREPAAEVVDELRHYYKQKIRIADPRLARQPLTLTFPFSNASDLGATLDRDPKVEVTTDEDGTLALHWQR